MQDSPQKRAVLIEYLLGAFALANELGDGNADTLSNAPSQRSNCIE